MTRDIWADLPPADCRWSFGRKQAVAAAIRAGLIGFNEARERYSLSTEELLIWEKERIRRLPKGRNFAAERRQAGAS